jgi:hypothetical protein
VATTPAAALALPLAAATETPLPFTDDTTFTWDLQTYEFT